MIAKAVANSLAEKLSTERGEKINGYFLNVKGPELLNKYVGETERKIARYSRRPKRRRRTMCRSSSSSTRWTRSFGRAERHLVPDGVDDRPAVPHRA
jgi:proteasome-associated ATPase